MTSFTCPKKESKIVQFKQNETDSVLELLNQQQSTGQQSMQSTQNNIIHKGNENKSILIVN